MVVSPFLLGGLLTIVWPTLAVRVTSTMDIPPARLDTARRTFERIMLQAGLATEWRYCGRAPHHTRAAACDTPLQPAEVVVRIVEDPAGLRSPTGPPSTPTPLGFSYVDGSIRGGVLATIFLNRLDALALRAGRDPGVLLGRTIAHEVAHLVLGTTGHSHSGLMRAEWHEREVRQDAAADWQFSPADAVRLRQKSGDLRLRSSAP